MSAGCVYLTSLVLLLLWQLLLVQIHFEIVVEHLPQKDPGNEMTSSAAKLRFQKILIIQNKMTGHHTEKRIEPNIPPPERVAF